LVANICFVPLLVIIAPWKWIYK